MNVDGFIGPSYTSISRSINAQRCVNLRLEVDLSNGKAPLALVGLPGYATVKDDFPAAQVRRFWKAAGRQFVVVGGKLFELDADLVHTERAGILSVSGHVSIADNGLQMITVDGSSVVALTLATNVVTTAIANFPAGATFIVCVDNTFVANEPNSQRFHVSAVGDGLTWRAIDFASVEGLPDDLVAIVAFNRQLYMMGTESMQVFWNSGDAERPFIAVEGSFYRIGCIAPGSAVADETGVYWLGADTLGGARVYKSAGGQVRPVSTTAMDAEFAGLLGQPAYTLEDAEGFCFREAGHTFYVLTFPTTDRTWLFDASTEGWSEYLEWDTAWHRHRASAAIYTFGKQIVGDFENGKLYELRSDIYANDDRTQRALRTSAHVSRDESTLHVGGFEVVSEPGVGLTEGQGADPQMMLRVSRDGTNTWTPEMTRPMGRKGEYRGRTRWSRPCGPGRDFVFEVSVTDPVKRAMVKAIINQA